MTLKTTQEATKCCDRCSEALTKEELEYPNEERDGWKVLCESCYSELFRDVCDRCGEYTDVDELAAKPGEIVAVMQTAPASFGAKELEPGYFRVKAWPFYTDAMFYGYLHADKLERLSALDERGMSASKESRTCATPLCEECRKAVQSFVDGLPSIPQQGKSIGGHHRGAEI